MLIEYKGEKIRAGYINGMPIRSTETVYKKGDYLINIGPTQSTEPLYRCVEAGNPGVWEVLGGTGGSIISIIDNLTSADTDKALSANQGKILKGLLDDVSRDKVDKVEGKGLSTNDFTNEKNLQLTKSFYEVGLLNTYDLIEWSDGHDGANILNYWKNRVAANSTIDLNNFVFDDNNGFTNGVLSNIRTSDGVNTLEVSDINLTNNNIWSITINGKAKSTGDLVLFCGDDYSPEDPKNYVSVFYEETTPFYSINADVNGEMLAIILDSPNDFLTVSLTRDSDKIYVCADGVINELMIPMESNYQLKHLYLGGNPTNSISYDIKTVKLYDSKIMQTVDGVIVGQQALNDYSLEYARDLKHVEKVHTAIDTIFGNIAYLQPSQSSILTTTSKYIPQAINEVKAAIDNIQPSTSVRSVTANGATIDLLTSDRCVNVTNNAQSSIQFNLIKRSPNKFSEVDIILETGGTPPTIMFNNDDKFFTSSALIGADKIYKCHCLWNGNYWLIDVIEY